MLGIFFLEFLKISKMIKKWPTNLCIKVLWIYHIIGVLLFRLWVLEGFRAITSRWIHRMNFNLGFRVFLSHQHFYKGCELWLLRIRKKSRKVMVLFACLATNMKWVITCKIKFYYSHLWLHGHCCSTFTPNIVITSHHLPFEYMNLGSFHLLHSSTTRQIDVLCSSSMIMCTNLEPLLASIITSPFLST
jgi:hypothetical protein